MSSIPTYTTLTTPIVERSSFWLTESPVHDPRTGLTWFTDIPDKSIYSFQHTSSDAQSTLRRIDVPDYVGCIALIDGDEKHLLLGAKKGVALIDVETEKVEYVNTMYEDEKVGERMRVNDGGVDVKGRFWFGSMRSFGLGPPDFEGTLWRSDTNKSLHSIISPVGVPNGIGWSPDNSIVYFTDTKKGTIFTYKFDPSTGAISSEDTFINFTQQPPEKYGPGSPDGLAIDTNGDLWVAMFNGNAVLHIDAKTKEPKGKIEFPTSKQVACPRFVPGGLLITTGKLVHMDPECGKSHSPHAGAVFFVKSEDIGGAQGREIYKAKLE